METVQTDVVICGAGPVGLTLAHLLGQQGVQCMVLERLDAPMAEPRAIAIDGESLRTLQKLDLLDGIQDMLLNGLEADYVNGAGERLFKVGRPEYRPYGYPMVNSFDQPALDSYLASELQRYDNVQMCFRHQLTGFEQDVDGVRVTCTDADGWDLAIDARYLVGCDGGRSTIRSLLHIDMQGQSNPQPWLVIDTRDAHLDNQLDCRFYCDPVRPGMTIRKQGGERRWEWMLMPGEEREHLLEDATIRALIAPYTDAQQVDIYRKRVYDFHALVADKWREGRVFLAGDAAHMTPPFAGQGLNSGLRDAANLGWKLGLVLAGTADPRLLDSYELDRRDHARELIQTALELGEQIQPIDPGRAAERDAFFAQLNQDPAAMEAMEWDLAKAVTNRRVHPSLLVTSGGSDIPGSLVIQPSVAGPSGAALLDDILGKGFAVLGVNCEPLQCLADSTRQLWNELGATFVEVRSAVDTGGDDALVDLDGALCEWLGDAVPVVLLVRPDRFCMALASPLHADAVLVEARDLLFGDWHHRRGIRGTSPDAETVS